MKFTEKTLVKHLNKCYGSDYTRARFQRDPIGGSQILLYRPGDEIPEIVDAVTPQALAQDMGFRSGSLAVSGSFVVA